MKPIFEIFLFEDDPSDAELIAIKLKQLDVGYQLTHVLNKEELEKELSDTIPDLIICDYNLPGVTGSEILSYIREKYPDLPFILISGFIDPSKAVEAMVAGASDYVMKDDLSRLIPAAKRELLRYKEKAKQQELLNEAHKIAKIGYWEYKPETKDLTWTDEIYHLHEVPLCQPIDLATGISFYREGPDRLTIEKAVENAINHGKPFDLELNILSAKGNDKWIHAIGQAEFRKGKCLRIFGSAQDITDRRRAQIKLEKTQQKLQNIILHSTNLYYEHDCDHNTTYVSPQSQNFFGLSPEECKLNWKRLLTDHPENQMGVQYTQKAIDTGIPQPEYELQAKHKDGSILWVRVNEAPVIYDGKTVAIVGSLTDITEQKQTFEKIQMLSKVASETQNLVMITDRKGIIEWVNKAFEKKTGFSLSESYGSKPHELLSGSATKPEIPKDHVSKIRNKESFTETTVMYTKKGTPFWVRSNISPIFDKNGEVKKYFSIQEDITQEIKFENELKLQNERLRESHIIGGLADWDYIVETGEVYWSENLYNIYERDPEKGPPDYEKVLSYYPDDHEYHDKKVREAIEKGKPIVLMLG